jgi:hypothetical protein
MRKPSRPRPEKKEPGEKGNEKKEGDKNGAGKEEKKEGEKTDGPVGSNRYLFVQAVYNKDLIAKPKLQHVFGEPHLPVKAPAVAEKAEKDGKEKGDKEKDKEKAAPKTPKETVLADSVKELMRLHEERLVDKAEYETRRKEVEDANKTAQREYDDKVKAAEARVKELNERFADWYYVIGDDVFKKIRVKRADIVKDPEKKDEKANDDAAKDKSDDASAP